MACLCSVGLEGVIMRHVLSGWRSFPGLALAGAGFFAAFTLTQHAVAAPTVDVTFSKGLTDRLNSIDRTERTLEERFRKTGTDDRSVATSTLHRFAKVKTSGTRWAGEHLIPNVEDYGLKTLITALTLDNLARAKPDFDGRIQYNINRLRVSSHPIAYLSGSNSYVTGTITVLSPDGQVVVSEKLSANLVVDPTVDRHYQGEKYAFIETDEEDRVGPTLSYFVERALERVFPDSEDDIHGPVIVRVSGPNESILYDRR